MKQWFCVISLTTLLKNHLLQNIKEIVKAQDRQPQTHFWEVVIKSSLNKPFDVDNPTLFRDGLFEAGLIEIPVKSEHTLVVADLPEKLHKDPFDRLIVAQAKHNKLPLITSDSKLIEFVSDYITIIPNR
ncbi:type II toxin-antitoxin system VapC family toxin [Salmonella enterica]|nr:type II toxin-antitoxin system VapC family toxin [Salmonella enterica]